MTIVECPRCGEENPRRARFCLNCAAPLAPSPPDSTRESRKTVTVLFCDLYALDRLDEADAWASRAAELGASDDIRKEMSWRQVKAKVLARRGQHDAAVRLAREAVAICDETEMLDAQGDVYADLAEVLSLAGRVTETATALGQALERYERKGNLVSTQRAQLRLRELQAAAE